jgi:cytochrome c oxidase assembly protein subunit 15
MAWGTVLVAVAFVQVLLGALVAGIDAGRNYADWPLMGGEGFPFDAFSLEPGWSNVVANPGLVQFDHRLVGYLLFVLGLVAWLRSRSSALGHMRGAFAAVMAMLVVQLVLGVLTVLHGAPMAMAVLHQLGAVVLFTLIVRARFAALYPRAQRIARG